MFLTCVCTIPLSRSGRVHAARERAARAGVPTGSAILAVVPQLREALCLVPMPDSRSRVAGGTTELHADHVEPGVPAGARGAAVAVTAGRAVNRVALLLSYSTGCGGVASRDPASTSANRNRIESTSDRPRRFRSVSVKGRHTSRRSSTRSRLPGSVQPTRARVMGSYI